MKNWKKDKSWPAGKETETESKQVQIIWTGNSDFNNLTSHAMKTKNSPVQQFPIPDGSFVLAAEIFLLTF